MTRSQWLRIFHGWITASETEALLYTQTFFDMRGVADDVQLVGELRTIYLPLVQGPQRLHAHLAKSATWRGPPLGFFRGLVLEKGGEHAETLDIKEGGTAVVVQMARLFTIAAGLPQLSIRGRLAASAGAGSVSRQDARDLADTFEFLYAVQSDHQQAQFNAGGQPNNHIYPKRLSNLEREHLCDVFGAIRKLQQSFGTEHPIWAISQSSYVSQLCERAMLKFFRPRKKLLGVPTHDDAQLVADVEITGLNPSKDQLLSIGWVVAKDRSIVSEESKHLIIRLEREEVSVGESATVHELTDDMVATGIEAEAAVGRLLETLRGRKLLMHYARMEIGFLGLLRRKCFDARSDVPMASTMIYKYDAILRANRGPVHGELWLWPLCDKYGIPCFKVHHAFNDALARTLVWSTQESRGV